MSRSKRFVLGILVIFIIMILIKFLLVENTDNVTEFDNILSDFSYVQSIDIYGSSPSLFLSFEIDEITTIDEVDRVFIRVRDLLLEKENFTNLMSFHKTKYGGTVTDIHIIFVYSSNGKKYYHDYFSFSDTGGVPDLISFNHWRVDRNGDEKDF